MKNMNEIRQVLAEEIKNLRESKASATNLNAIVNAVNSILRTVKLELECAKLTNSKAGSSFIQLEEKVALDGVVRPLNPPDKESFA